MHHFPFHISDFFQAVARCTPEQVGVYILLLLEYYKNEKALPATKADLEFLCGIQTPKQRAALEFVLGRFFTLTEDGKGYFQKRADREIDKYRAGCVQNRYAILCRHWDKVNKGHKKPTFEDFAAKPEQYYDDATNRIREVTARKRLVLESYTDRITEGLQGEYQPVPNNQEPVTTGTPIAPKGAVSDEALAEAIYLIYPKKVGKGAAIKAILKALKKSKLTEMEMQLHVRSYAAAVSQWAADERQYIPNPATWFNQERYLDDPTTWKRAEPLSQTPGFRLEKKGGAAAEEARGAVLPLGDEEPEGWKDAWAACYSFPCPKRWREVPDANRADVLTELQKRKGGAA